MQTRLSPRRSRGLLEAALAATVSLLPFALVPSSARAQTRVWSGAGGSDLWNDAGNWTGGVPSNGDNVVFGVNGGGDSINNLVLSLTSLRFDAAVVPAHTIHIADGAALTFTGTGIDNDAVFVPGGVLQQQFFADAGGTMTFQNAATIGGRLGVELMALGATVPGGSGGRIVLMGNSRVLTVLRAHGATVAGANGGELLFQDDASMGPSAAFTVQSGAVAGAAGGTAIFEGRSVASGNTSNFTGAGFGGRVIFRANASTTNISLSNLGGEHAGVSAEALTQFQDDAVLTGTALNFAGLEAGSAGGRLEFRNRSRFDGTPVVGSLSILNRGAVVTGASSGRTVFHDDTRVVGANTLIRNDAEDEDPVPGTIGGITEFLGRSRAGQSTINNRGAASAAAGTLGGRTFFRENSSSESATITASGGKLEIGASGASVEFSGQSTAANATLTATSGTSGGLGGRIVFAETASGGSASVMAELDGALDMSALATAGTTLGSIAGEGEFFLGGKMLTVGSSNTSTVVNGVIRDGGQAGGAGATLTKVGTGTLELGGANTYTGPTNVNAGTLLVTGSLGNGSVAVAHAATLAGTGTIGGMVTVADGGTMAPGKTGAGTLSVSGLVLNAVSNLRFELSTAGVVGGVNDLITVNGSLTLDGVLHIGSIPPGLTSGTYRLIDYVGVLTDAGLTIGTVPAGTSAGDFTVQTTTPGQVNLVLGIRGDALFWDGSQTTANGAINGGSGTWDTVRTNWTNGAGTVQSPWAGQLAVFAGAAGTVSVLEDVSTSGMQFVTNGYMINASAGRSIALAGAAAVRTEVATTTTINASLTGGALTKTGTGSLVLTGNNNHAGGTTVEEGILLVRNAAGFGLGSGPVTVLASPTSLLIFETTGSAGSVSITNKGSASGTFNGWTLFKDTVSGGAATVLNEGNTAAGGMGGALVFGGANHLGTTNISNLGARFTGLAGVEGNSAGRTLIRSTAMADTATITNFGGEGAGVFGGSISFLESANAGSATITNRGGAVAGAFGGSTHFMENSTASNSTLIVGGGTNGGLGGKVRFLGPTSGGTARVIFNPGDTGDGAFDISGLTGGTTTTVGSLEGTGMVFLGSKTLNYGHNNLSTEFSGVISDGGDFGGVGGTLQKSGTGRLTLSGNNTYTGQTTVAAGELAVRTATGMGLGTGGVNVLPQAKLLFIDSALAGANAISLSPANLGGNGAWLELRNTASAGNATIQLLGSQNSSVLTNPTAYFYHNSSAGSATFTNFGGQANNSAHGGDIIFWDNATAASATISNFGAAVAGAQSAHVSFYEDSTARMARITNFGTATKDNRGSDNGGSLSFVGNATGGSAIVLNLGALASGGSPGTTRFFDATSAVQAAITNGGGQALGALGGWTIFGESSAMGGSATADSATITNQRGTVAGGAGGNTLFVNTATAGASRIINEGGVLAEGPASESGFTRFAGMSDAGSAQILNMSSIGNAFSGATYFTGAVRAGTAQITNRGQMGPVPGRGGFTDFATGAKAGTATIVNEGSSVPAPPSLVAGGRTIFSGGASAEQATITNKPAVTVAGSPGVTEFFGDAAPRTTAGNATIINEGGLFNSSQNGGRTEFFGSATAGAATIRNLAGRTHAAFGAVTNFRANSDAGTARILNEVNSAGLSVGGGTFFLDSSSAANASILNRSSVGGAYTTFLVAADAGQCMIENEGATVLDVNGGLTSFGDNTSARQATITSRGGTAAGAVGGRTYFALAATADRATLIAGGGTDGGRGGEIFFTQTSRGGTARVILNGRGAAGGALDISGLTTTGTQIGSIEGTGNLFLGGKRLEVGGNTLDTAFTGAIQDGGFHGGAGGGVTKVGPGALTLTGANSYTAGTAIHAGTLRANNVAGSATGTGAVTVNNTGTLGGSGAIAGGVTINNGGTISPGASAGALATGSETWNGGGKYRWEINAFPGRGATAAAGADPGWDSLNINGTLNINAPSFNKFTIEITSLALAAVGVAANFNSLLPYRLPIATATGGISGFSPEAFAFSPLNFLNPLHGSVFGLEQSGNTLDLTFKPPTGLTSGRWISQFPFPPGGEALLADPEGDGVSNLLEYGLAMDPLQSDVGLLPELSSLKIEGLRYQTLTYEKVADPYGPTDLTYAVERKETVPVATAWSSAGVVLHSRSVDPVTGIESITMRSETPIAEAGVMGEFLRLSVTKH